MSQRITCKFIILNSTISLIILIFAVNGNLPNKIYGGTRILIYRRPWMASVQLRNHHMCGGTIISASHVATAATCVTANKNVFYSNLQVISGMDDIMEPHGTPNRQIHHVEFVIIHKDYEPRSFWINDIAILKLVSKIKLNLSSQPAVFLDGPSSPKKYATTGWGNNPITGTLTRYLQETGVKSISNNMCKDKYYQQGVLTKSQYCLLPTLKSARITEGNGGSPVIAGSTLIGIISLVPTTLDYPAVYTRLYFYHMWINEIVTGSSY